MKSIFPGLSIICGTALIIAGNTTAGIVFAVLGFCGALAGAAIRHQQEVEALAVAKEFIEALSKKSTSEDQIAEMQAAMGLRTGPTICTASKTGPTAFGSCPFLPSWASLVEL